MVSTSDCESEDMGSIPIGHTYMNNAVCPGGEGAVLKTVGLSRLAGSGVLVQVQMQARESIFLQISD